jgi:hypothetical protein
MAWSDGPTPAQIGAWANLVKWDLPDVLINEACKFIEKNMTRKEISEELGRTRDLYMKRKITEDSCFNSPVWDKFKAKR